MKTNNQVRWCSRGKTHNGRKLYGGMLGNHPPRYVVVDELEVTEGFISQSSERRWFKGILVNPTTAI